MYERVKVLVCLEYQRIPEIPCKGANMYQPQTGRLLGSPGSPFSKLSLENLVLLHLLLEDFMNFVVEIYGQQGVAMGVRCVQVKREVSFFFVDK